MSRRRIRTDGDNPDPATSLAPYRLYNIGNNRPVELMRYIEVLERCLGRKATMNLLPLQVGDVRTPGRMPRPRA
jgi:UDP-glucuronate 4-epimerase